MHACAIARPIASGRDDQTHRRTGTAVMRKRPAFRYFNGGSGCVTVA
jgi:hypothetical protein